MPLKLSVGLTKKVGLPDYGSVGASCQVEIELDGSLLDSDLAGFHERAQNAFTACRQAVSDELARQQPAGQVRPAYGTAATNSATRTDGATAATGNGHASPRSASTVHRASGKQLDYARQLAGQIRGLGTPKLDALATKMFGKPLAELSSFDASGLIDTLKLMKGGDIDVNAVLFGAAA